MKTLVIATRNAHKVGEIRAILGEGFRCLTLEDFPEAPEVVEDAGTFAGNATKKAVALAKWLSEGAEPEAGETRETAYTCLPTIPAWKWMRWAGRRAFIRRVSQRWVQVIRAILRPRRIMPSCCVCSKMCLSTSGLRGFVACWR